MTKVHFSTREFEFSHGRKPKGRGGWWFEFEGQENMDDWFSANGTFSEARRAATVEARRRFPGQPEVFVNVLP